MYDLNIKETEIPPKEIFDKMKNNIYNNFMFQTSLSINKDYLSSRKTLFSILNTITKAFSFKSRTFFLCSYYLDIIYLSKKTIKLNTHLMGLACLCLSTKVCENDPEVPHLKYFLEVYDMIMDYKNEISVDDLKNAEIYVLKLLNYKLDYYSVYDFNSFFFNNGILKLDQLKDIESFKNDRFFRKKRKKLVINEYNSLKIKNILEQMYKKSRYYLDIVVNKTNLCFKYNSLFLSLYIIQRSIIEVLSNEQEISLCGKEEQAEFYKNNSLVFKEVIFDFYRIEYETNEQYKKLLLDNEMLEVFETNTIDNQVYRPQIEEKKDDEKENNNLENNKNNNNENKSTFTSLFNESYRKIKLKMSSNDLNKRQNKRIEKIAIRTKMDKNKIMKNNNDKSSERPDVLISHRNRQLKKNSFSTSNKTDISIKYSFKNKEQEKEELPNKNFTKKHSYIPISNKYIPRNESCSNIKNKSELFKNNYNLNDLENAHNESKFPLYKYKGEKTERNSPIKNDENKFSIYKYKREKSERISPIKKEDNKFSIYKYKREKSERISPIKREDSKYSVYKYKREKSERISPIKREDSKFSVYKYKREKSERISPNNEENKYSLYKNNGDKTERNSPIKNDDSTFNNNFINYPRINKYRKIKRTNKGRQINLYYNNVNDGENEGKKSFYKRLIHKNTVENNASSHFFYSNNNIDKNQLESENLDSLTINDNENEKKNNNNNLKVNSFYNRMNSRKKIEEKNGILNVSINLENDKTYKNNNDKENSNKILVIPPTRNRSRYHYNLNRNNSGDDLKNKNIIILKDNKSKEIDPSNDNNLNDSKGFTSNNFYKNKKDKITVNIKNFSEKKLIESNKSLREPKKSMSNLINNHNNNLNIARSYSKNKIVNKEQKEDNIIKKEKKENKSSNNNDKDINSYNIKVNFTKSIRKKYLSLNKNKSTNNINQNTKPLKEVIIDNNDENNSNNHQTNINANRLKTRYTYKNNYNKSINNLIGKIPKRTYNIDITNHMNNINKYSLNRTEKKENKEKNNNEGDINQPSTYRIKIKTKTLFKRNSNEEEKNKQYLREDTKTNTAKSRNPSYNFLKPKINNNKNNKNEKDIEEKKTKEIIIKKQQDKKIGNNSYLRNIVYKNSNKRDKIEKTIKNQKNYSALAINMNINNNNENKNVNIPTEYNKYKYIIKRNNDIGRGLYSNYINYKNDINLLNKNNINRYDKNNNMNYNENSGNFINNILINRFQLYNKIIDKDSNNNDNYYYANFFKRK